MSINTLTKKPPTRVLMLGWEFPPRFAGGLGKACAGLSQAMAKTGAQVYFVLPSYPKRFVSDRLHVVGAKELLVEAGWASESSTAMTTATGGFTNSASQPVTEGMVIPIRTSAQLLPYGQHPQGILPPTIRRMLGETIKLTPLRLDEHTQKQDHSKPHILSEPEIMIDPVFIDEPVADEKEIYGKNLWSEIEKYCFAVRQLAKTQEVDVIHAHDWMSFPAALEYQQINPKTPFFAHVHATEYDRSGKNVNSDVFRIEREGFRRATHIFAVSKYTAGIIERLYGIAKEKITVVYNAPDEETKELILSPDSKRSPRVIFLGRLTFQKGPDHFLEAARIVIKAAPPSLGRIQFVFCGTGDMLEKLRIQAHTLGIEDRVHFAGFIEPRDVDRILLKSKVLVMPSVSEPFGLVALEAIHCGIPVILSKQSGVREVLPRALQVDFWDHERLADQILAALRLKDLSKQLVDDGISQLKNLSWEKSAQTVMETYRRYV